MTTQLSLEGFLEEAKANASQPLVYRMGEFRSRTWLAQEGCDGVGEYTSCEAMSRDYERMAREHATMLALIEKAQSLGRYLDDAYEEVARA
jgi:hypothetical protein